MLYECLISPYGDVAPDFKLILDAISFFFVLYNQKNWCTNENIKHIYAKYEKIWFYIYMQYITRICN